MFWRKKGETGTHQVFRQQCDLLAEKLLAAAGIDFDKGTKLQQALIGTFLFGMLTAEGMGRGLSPTEIRAIALGVFEDCLHYTPQAAVEGVENCIQATGPDAHDTMKAIIHRGIDGHRQTTKGDGVGLTQNIRDILHQFNV